MNLGGVIHLNKTGICVLCGLILILVFYSILSRENRIEETQSSLVNLHNLIEVAIKAAENGGKEVVQTKDNVKIKSKGLTKEGLQDSVTTADFLSHCSMVTTLKHFFPRIKIISEEAKTSCKSEKESEKNIDYSFHNILLEALTEEVVNIEDIIVWIDPLDATYEYAEKSEKLYHFVTTMVCVAVKGKPIIGVIHKPFNKSTSWAWVGKGKSVDLTKMQLPMKLFYKVESDAEFLFKIPLDVTKENIKLSSASFISTGTSRKNDQLKIIVSISHQGEIEKILNQNLATKFQLIMAAGAGYKALEVAYGNVDAYLHITAIKKWDICAGNAIINALGGKMTTKYNKEIDYADDNNVKNEDGLIASLVNHDIFLGKL